VVVLDKVIMFDWVVWTILITLVILGLLGILKILMDYPGLLKWKCIYHDKRRDKLEIDLSEYELAAIEIPDRRRTGSTVALIGQNQQASENRLQVPGTSSGRKQHHNNHHVRIVEPEPCKFKEYIDEGVQTDNNSCSTSDICSDIHPPSVMTVTSDGAISVRSEVSASSLDPKEKLFQDKIIVIDEVRQC